MEWKFLQCNNKLFISSLKFRSKIQIAYLGGVDIQWTVKKVIMTERREEQAIIV